MVPEALAEVRMRTGRFSLSRYCDGVRRRCTQRLQQAGGVWSPSCEGCLLAWMPSCDPRSSPDSWLGQEAQNNEGAFSNLYPSPQPPAISQMAATTEDLTGLGGVSRGSRMLEEPTEWSPWSKEAETTAEGRP